MALPPIISNLPFVKSLQNAGKDTPGKAAAPAAEAANITGDVVALRSAGLESRVPQGDADARALAAETRDALAESNYTLGLDRKFA